MHFKTKCKHLSKATAAVLTGFKCFSMTGRNLLCCATWEVITILLENALSPLYGK